MMKNMQIINKIVLCIFIYLLGSQITFSQENQSRNELLEVIETVTENLIENPNSTFYYSVRANAYYSLGEFDKTLRDLTFAIQLDSNDWELYYNKGVVLYDLGKVEESITEFNNAIGLNKQNCDIYFARALSYYEIEKINKAISDYTKSISLNNYFDDAYNNRGLCYNSLEEYKLAIKDFSEAIKLMPGIAKYYYNRGYANFKIDSINEAINDLQKANCLDTLNIYGYYYLSLVYKKIGKIDKFNFYLTKAKDNGLPENLFLNNE